MQIFIVYAHVHDLIVPVQIIIRFYPSSAGKKPHFEIYLVMEELHLQIRLPAINIICPHIPVGRISRLKINTLLWTFFF